MSSTYDLNDLINACKNNGSVFFINKAEKSAREDFGLNTKQDVLTFIATKGLEKPFLINTKPWKNNTDKQKKIMDDAYS